MTDQPHRGRSTETSRRPILRFAVGATLGAIAGLVVLVATSLALNLIRAHGPVTMLAPGGTAVRVRESQRTRILRGPSERAVQTCRGACDEIRL